MTFVKYIYYIMMLLLITAVFIMPLSENPQYWYQLPLIPGLGEKARIIFFHVPAAWVTVLAFLMSTINSILYLAKKDIIYDIKAHSAAQLGLLFCFLATFTGSVWAKFTWGAFWHWDPRETSIFILLLIYGAYFALRPSISGENKRAALSSAYLVIAFITVPFFIFVMPSMMSGLHPGSAGDTAPVTGFRMNSNMSVVFFASLFLFTVLFLWIWELKFRSLVCSYRTSKTPGEL